MKTDAGALSPETVMRQMKQNGVTDIVWLPDSETNWLYPADAGRSGLRLVGVTREGHACSIAAGLFAGGRKPMMLIQNTGMMESGDSIRGWLMGLKVPIVLMVGYRGYTRHGVNTDTAATYTERFLMAFGIHSTWWRTMPMRRASPSPSRRRQRTRGRSSSWSATNITASTGRSEHAMMHTADLLKVFAEHRGDAIVVPAAAAGIGWRSSDTGRWTCRWAIRRWAAMPGSVSASRWRSRTGA